MTQTYEQSQQQDKSSDSQRSSSPYGGEFQDITKNLVPWLSSISTLPSQVAQEACFDLCFQALRAAQRVSTATQVHQDRQQIVADIKQQVMAELQSQSQSQSRR